ncbi:hypothetical protein VP382E491_P0034 [Vibrio phage 382E49-1]|nr:hypothetical protein VP141O351_P0033 [Vibrio phage 141O35-1]CAH9015261.1 hypothetical protein VP141E351_P0032 [Vibrio phage 141E35-1]CAH9015889.1 hypothetical protein VP382E491_P0034 [Vibrio phage 382E49-1]
MLTCVTVARRFRDLEAVNAKGLLGVYDNSTKW